MPFDPIRHHRRSIRLKGFDYSAPGCYFVTICVQGRLCLFGEITEGQMRQSEAGLMVESLWEAIPLRVAGVELDSFVLMPNHLHGVIALTPDRRDISFPEVIQRFKSLTTAKYRKGVEQLGWIPFPARLWQRGYFERIIRTNRELESTRQYISENPIAWESDPENPSARPPVSP